MSVLPFDRLVQLMRGRRVVVLTGAGISTDSGIPDYRGPETRRRARNPIQYRAFISDPEARMRYWARSSIGWQRIAEAQPNAGHRALAALEQAGIVTGIITQNVDRLHHAAGSQRVVELHGALGEVSCLDCGTLEARTSLQQRLLNANPGWAAQPATFAPDGDADLAPERTRSFQVPACQTCAGVLKPNVVFFGESVPRTRVDAAWALFDQADLLLVAGSSLTVYSGYRFVRKAAQANKPVVILNLGPTRGDREATLRFDVPLSAILPRLARALATRSVK